MIAYCKIPRYHCYLSDSDNRSLQIATSVAECLKCRLCKLPNVERWALHSTTGANLKYHAGKGEPKKTTITTLMVIHVASVEFLDLLNLRNSPWQFIGFSCA